MNYDTTDYDPPQPLEYSEAKRLGSDYLQDERFGWDSYLNSNGEVLVDIRDFLQLDDTPTGACFELDTEQGELDFGEIWLCFGNGSIFLDTYYERYK